MRDDPESCFESRPRLPSSMPGNPRPKAFHCSRGQKHSERRPYVEVTCRGMITQAMGVYQGTPNKGLVRHLVLRRLPWTLAPGVGVLPRVEALYRLVRGLHRPVWLPALDWQRLQRRSRSATPGGP
jgi:hypothetical protein